jgi:hypothetical protein
MRHIHRIVLFAMLVAATVWIDAAALRAISVSGVRDRGTTMFDLRIDAGRVQLFRISFLLLGAPGHR